MPTVFDVVGRQGWLSVTDELDIIVNVTETRTVYGRQEYHVTPVAGGGKAWVYADRVDLIKPSQERKEGDET